MEQSNLSASRNQNPNEQEPRRSSRKTHHSTKTATANPQAKQRNKRRSEAFPHHQCPYCLTEVIVEADDFSRHLQLHEMEIQCAFEVTKPADESEMLLEYEWAGQTRIRVSTLAKMESSTGDHPCSSPKRSKTKTDEDGNVDVDGEDKIYGEAQYTEVDLVPPKDDSSTPLPLKHPQTELSGRPAEEKTIRCMICMDSYENPLVSVICWHVHCESCWMRCLGMKKLCPQCQLITCPSNLRKIFL